MKKLVLTTLAACVSMAFAGAYAESTTSKEPIRLAQSSVSDSAQSGESPKATKQRPKREPKEGAKRSDGTPRVKDATSVQDEQQSGQSPKATKDRPKREVKELPKRSDGTPRVKDPTSTKTGD